MSFSTVIQAVVKMFQAAMKFLKPIVIAVMLAAVEELATGVFSSAKDWISKKRAEEKKKGFGDDGFGAEVAA